MQTILNRLISQLRADGKDPAAANAIARAQLEKHGILDKHGALTPKGRVRQAMGPAGRAKDRAAKASGGRHRPEDFSYNAKTNEAKLKPRLVT